MPGLHTSHKDAPQNALVLVLAFASSEAVSEALPTHHAQYGGNAEPALPEQVLLESVTDAGVTSSSIT